WLMLYYGEPIEIDHGEGRHVWDAEGNRYLDFFGGVLTTMTAHALPEVTAAVSEQAGKILHSSTLYLNRPMIELAEQVAELSGLDDPKVFFTTSGTSHQSLPGADVLRARQPAAGHAVGRAVRRRAGRLLRPGPRTDCSPSSR